MNAPTLFDAVGSRPAEVTGSTETGHGRGVAAPPTARLSDPTSSHEAAATVKPGNGALIRAIRQAASNEKVPATAFVIAARVEHVHPRRWDEGTIRSAISRAGLRAVDCGGESPRSTPTRKIRCIRYTVDGA